MQQTETAPTGVFMKLKQVAAHTSLSAATILRREKAGRFPRGITLSATLRVWRKTEVDAWIEEATRNRAA